MTAGGNLINCDRELEIQAVDVLTSKMLWNSTVSTKGAKYACLDIKNFTLAHRCKSMNI